MTDNEPLYSEMTIDQLMDVICARWGKTRAELLPSEIKRYRAALIADQENSGKPVARRPVQPVKAVTPVPATLDGMQIDSDEFQALPPRERIRKFREAEAAARREKSG